MYLLLSGTRSSLSTRLLFASNYDIIERGRMKNSFPFLVPKS
jgi:hypothetical protein